MVKINVYNSQIPDRFELLFRFQSHNYNLYARVFTLMIAIRRALYNLSFECCSEGAKS